MLNPSNRNTQIYLIVDVSTRRTSGSSVATASIGVSKFDLVGFEPFNIGMGNFGDISPSLYLVDYDGGLINSGSNRYYKEITT